MDSTATIAQRLCNQRLSQPGGSAHDVVAYMGAMQAQDYYGALWSVGARTGLTEKQVVEALEKREIIRTWPQRGTLHVVAPEDAGWMTALSAERLIKGAKRRHENLGLDSATLERSKEVFAKALQGGKSLTRPEMLEVLESAAISTKVGRGYHMLWYAAQTGLIYIGPMQAKQQTFGLITDLPVTQRKLSREESIVELARRYFTSRSPATLQDFMWWSGLTSAEAKMGFIEVAPINPTPAIPKALLLSGFDEYLLGYKDRSVQMNIEHASKVVPGSNGMFMPTIVIDGRVVGIWKRTIKPGKKAGVSIAYDLFDEVSHDMQKQIVTIGESYARFLGLPLSASIKNG